MTFSGEAPPSRSSGSSGAAHGDSALEVQMRSSSVSDCSDAMPIRSALSLRSRDSWILLDMASPAGKPSEVNPPFASPTASWAAHTSDMRERRDLQNSQSYLEVVEPEVWKPGRSVAEPFEAQAGTLYMPGTEEREKPEAATATGIGSDRVSTRTSDRTQTCCPWNGCLRVEGSKRTLRDSERLGRIEPLRSSWVGTVLWASQSV